MKERDTNGEKEREGKRNLTTDGWYTWNTRVFIYTVLSFKLQTWLCRYGRVYLPKRFAVILAPSASFNLELKGPTQIGALAFCMLVMLLL